MSRCAQLLALAERLRSASAAGDWPNVGDADRELAVLLRRMALRDVMAPGERAAVATVRLAHAEAAARCSAEAARVQGRLDGMTHNRDGWMAYAADTWEGKLA